MDTLLLIDHLLTLILVLYGDPNLPRFLFDTVVEFLDKFIKDVYVPSIKADVMKILKNEKLPEACKTRLNSVFSDHSKLFDNIKYERKRFKILERKGFPEPEIFEVG